MWRSISIDFVCDGSLKCYRLACVDVRAVAARRYHDLV